MILQFQKQIFFKKSDDLYRFHKIKKTNMLIYFVKAIQILDFAWNLLLVAENHNSFLFLKKMSSLFKKLNFDI